MNVCNGVLVWAILTTCIAMFTTAFAAFSMAEHPKYLNPSNNPGPCSKCGCRGWENLGYEEKEDMLRFKCKGCGFVHLQPPLE